MVQIAGMDGCRAQWLAIAHEPASFNFTASLLETDDLAVQSWALVAIDIPIGLPEAGPRDADVLARKFIQPRGSSVFPSPIRPALVARSWSEACEITAAHDGRRISQQTFAILPKIRDVDRCIRSTSLADRIFEVHPEVCFAAWQGKPMPYPKRDRRGHQHRRRLIDAFFGASAFDEVTLQLKGKRVALDDIADAFAALWSANRLYSRTAGRFPVDSVKDRLGLPMHIWY